MSITTEVTTRAAGVEPLLELVSADLRVPVLGGADRRYVDLDVAATAPALAVVAERAAQLLPHAGSVHRGAGLPSRWSTALLEESRERVAHAVGTRSEDVVIFTRNTTDALSLLASAVPAGAGVVTLDIEHHANLLPWQQRGDHRVVFHAPTLAETLERLEHELEYEPAALVSVTGASNVTGELLPIAEIVEIAHRHGARVAVDGAQLIPHGEIDLAETGVDYLAFSGHKVYAPFGAGVLAGRRDWLDAAPPYLPGGGAVQEVSTVQTKWASAPQRHEGGTPNLVGAATLADALTTLARIPLEKREAHERALHARLEAGLSAIDGVRLHRIWSDSERIGVVCFSVDGYEPGHVASYLSAEHAIGVRDGRFCAHPLVRRLDLDHEGALRASLGVGSWRGDVDRIVGAVGQLVDQGSRARYEQTGGLWEPCGDDRRAPSWLVGDISAARPSPCGG